MRISVMIPVYNRDQRMHRQDIDSVLEQRFADYELIVADEIPEKVGTENAAVRKTLVQEIGPRKGSSSRRRLDDFHFCLKAGMRGPGIVLRDPVAVAYRLHESNAHLDDRQTFAQFRRW